MVAILSLTEALVSLDMPLILPEAIGGILSYLARA